MIRSEDDREAMRKDVTSSIGGRYLAGLKNTVEVCEDVLADVMIARVYDEDDVHYSKQRQQHHCRAHRFPDNESTKGNNLLAEESVTPPT